MFSTDLSCALPMPASGLHPHGQTSNCPLAHPSGVHDPAGMLTYPHPCFPGQPAHPPTPCMHPLNYPPGRTPAHLTIYLPACLSVRCSTGRLCPRYVSAQQSAWGTGSNLTPSFLLPVEPLTQRVTLGKQCHVSLICWWAWLRFLDQHMAVA